MRNRVLVMLRQAIHGFTDDLEVALYRLPQQAVVLVVVQCLAPHGLAYEGRRVANILKQLGRLRMNRRADVTY